MILKTFTLTLNNTCSSITYASVYFRLNNGIIFNKSKTIDAEASETFTQNFNIDESEENIMHVTGDYTNNFIIT